MANPLINSGDAVLVVYIGFLTEYSKLLEIYTKHEYFC